MLYLELPPDRRIGGILLSYGIHPAVLTPNIPYLVAIGCQLVTDGYRVTRH
jgi:hypothetical protein